MNDFIKAMLAEEHTVENWKKAWLASREYTAAGPLGIDLVSIDEDEVVLRMPITSASRQPYGLLHGGVSMVLAESAASFHSCWNRDLTKRVPVGIEINGTHLESASSGHVVATGRVVRSGQTLIVHEIRIVHEETGKLLNVSRVTNMLVDNPNA